MKVVDPSQLPAIANLTDNEDVNVKARATSPDGRFLKFEEEIGIYLYKRWEVFTSYIKRYWNGTLKW